MPEGDFPSDDTGVGYLVNQLSLEGLTQVRADGRALPRLATSWTWEAGDRRLRLTLRDNVVLHDGRRLDAQLAAEALAIAITRTSVRAAYPALREIRAAIPNGPFDLALELARPSALLAEDLTVLLDIPAGPFRVTRRSGDEVEMERFDGYYLGTPSIARVHLKPFATLRTAWASLLRGEVDFVYDVPPDALEFVRGRDVQIASVTRWYQYAMAFNSHRGPLRSPQVRRALNMAVNRAALVDGVLHGAGAAASGPLWPSYWAADGSLHEYPFDPTAAAELLDQAGFPVTGSTGDGRSARFTLTCLLPANFSVLERLALHVQKDLFNIGVDLRFAVVSVQEFVERMGKGEFEDAVLLDMISGPTPARADMFWGSGRRYQGVYNIFGYDNPEADRLFESLRTTRNEAAVRSATGRLQRVLFDDPPALFLVWNERARAIRREFVFPDEPGVDPIFSLWRWTRRPETLAASLP